MLCGPWIRRVKLAAINLVLIVSDTSVSSYKPLLAKPVVASAHNNKMAHNVILNDAAKIFLADCIEKGMTEVPAVQATLKMSGHLITARGWNGKLVLAAKNSAGNAFTEAAELLLSDLLGGPPGLSKLALSLQRAGVCANFECITAFCGDHGYPGRPDIDVMVCTAVHELTDGASRPWTQGEVFRFCREQGLPCTDTLISFDGASATKVFKQYELLRHQFGPHSDQVERFFTALTQPGDPNLSPVLRLACLPHSHINGVVEGFVVRSILITAQEISNLLDMGADCREHTLNMDSIKSHKIRNALKPLPGGQLTADGGARQKALISCLMNDLSGASSILHLSRTDSCQLSDRKGKKIETSPDTDAAKLVAALLSNHADDPSTTFIVNTLKTCQALGVAGRLLRYIPANNAKNGHIPVASIDNDIDEQQQEEEMIDVGASHTTTASVSEVGPNLDSLTTSEIPPAPVVSKKRRRRKGSGVSSRETSNGDANMDVQGEASMVDRGASSANLTSTAASVTERVSETPPAPPAASVSKRNRNRKRSGGSSRETSNGAADMNEQKEDMMIDAGASRTAAASVSEIGSGLSRMTLSEPQPPPSPPAPQPYQSRRRRKLAGDNSRETSNGAADHQDEEKVSNVGTSRTTSETLTSAAASLSEERPLPPAPPAPGASKRRRRRKGSGGNSRETSNGDANMDVRNEEKMDNSSENLIAAAAFLSEIGIALAENAPAASAPPPPAPVASNKRRIRGKRGGGNSRETSNGSNVQETTCSNSVSNRKQDATSTSSKIPAGADQPLQLLFVHVTMDEDQYKFHRYALDHPTAGVLYRGFVIRVWQDDSDSKAGSSPKMRAEVFMNFYPKFDNAKEQGGQEIINSLWPKDGGVPVAGGTKKFKFSYYMYATMLCRTLVELMGRRAARKDKGAVGVSLVEFQELSRKKLTTWGMDAVEQQPYLRRLEGWWRYVDHATAVQKRVLVGGMFLDPFADFLEHEEKWCGSSTFGEESHSNSTSTVPSVLTRPVYVLIGGCVTRAYAGLLSQKLRVPIVDGEGGQGNTRKKGQESTKSTTYAQDGVVVVLGGDKGPTAGRISSKSWFILDRHAVDTSVNIGTNDKQKSNSKGSKDGKGSRSRKKKGGNKNQQDAGADDLVEGVNRGSSVPQEWLLIAQRSGCRVVEISQKDLQLEDGGVQKKDDVSASVTPEPGEVAQLLEELEGQKVLPEVVALLGIPGGGKSTVAEELKREFGAQIVSSEALPDKAGGQLIRRTGPEFNALLTSALKPLDPIDLQNHTSTIHDTMQLSNGVHSEHTNGEKQVSPLVIRDKNLPYDQFIKVVEMANRGRAIAIALGCGCDCDGRDEAILQDTAALTLWELAVCLRRVFRRPAHPSLHAESLGTPAIVCMFAALQGVLYDLDGHLTSSAVSRTQWLSSVHRLFGSHRTLFIPLCSKLQWERPIPPRLAGLLSIGLEAMRKGSTNTKKDMDFSLKVLPGWTENASANTGIEQKVKGGKSDDKKSSKKHRDKQDNDVGPLESIWEAELRKEIMQAEDDFNEIELGWDNPELKEALKGVVEEVRHILSDPTAHPLENDALTSLDSSSMSFTRRIPPPPAPAQRLYYCFAVQGPKVAESLDHSVVANIRRWLQHKWNLTWDISKTLHITLLFIKKGGGGNQDEQIKALDALLEQTAEVEVSGVACDGHAAAISVESIHLSTPSRPKVLCDNEYPHFTLCTADGIKARHSNDMLTSGQYELRGLAHRVTLRGIITAVGPAGLQ